MWEFVAFLALAVAVAAFLPVPGAGYSDSRRARLRRAAARRIASAAQRLRPRRRVHQPPPDPFQALELQYRLGVVAEQVRSLHEDDDCTVYAKAHRLEATQAAYDGLLQEACKLAGVNVTIPTQSTRVQRLSESERLREEVELAARGWSW